ncbi:MAG: hypothetical protein WBW94_12480 [Anaerolineales bacterium]
MKLSLIAMILLIATACAPQPTVLPEATQLPIPVVITSEPPITSAVGSGTSMPICICPTGIVTPTQSQSGGIGLPPVICNCPAILVSPPVTTTETESSLQNISTGGITLADNGKNFIMHRGDSFLLNLGMDTFDWTVEIDNQNVLSRVKGVMVIRGAQGIYQAISLGQAVLKATGNPLCRNLVPACEIPSILFKIIVIVQ